VRELLFTALALAAVCTLAFFCLKGLKQLQGAGGAAGVPAELRFVRALPLGPRERLVVVEWRGETLLLGVTAGGVSVLDRSGAEAPVENDPPGTGIAPADLTRTLLARVFARRPRENPS
jgi:flagellar protein FliO/FliZ